MAAPAPAIRNAPAGTRMDDGFRTLVAFTADPAASFWEKTVTPPGMDGGDPIDTTTMHNETWRTTSPRQLVTMTDVKITAAWDPGLYVTLLELLNVKTTVTVIFPDLSSLAFYGFLRMVEPGDNTEGEQPEITITVVVTNQDPETGEEESPVFTEAPASPIPQNRPARVRSNYQPDRDHEAGGEPQADPEPKPAPRRRAPQRRRPEPATA